MGDLLDQLLVLLADLAALEAGEAAEAQVDDGLRLTLGELEALLEGVLRGLLVLRAADDRDHLVEVVEDLDQALRGCARGRAPSPARTACAG